MADVMREFLVDLGFSVDHSSLNKFTNTLETTGKAVFRFGETLAATVVGAGIALERFSSNLESLYFSAQRVGSSSSSLRAFDQAARNFGTTAGEAQASVEGLATALRMSPGNMAMLGGLLSRVGASVSTDNVANMVALGRVFQQMPMYQAEMYAGHFGIDERTMLAMRSGQFGAEYRRQGGLNKGLAGPTAEAHQLQIQVRDVETRLTTATGKLSATVIKDLLPALRSLESWMDRFDPKAIKTLGNDIGTALKWLTGPHPELEKLVTHFNDLNKATHGWLGNLLLAQGVLTAMGAGGLLPGVAGGLIGVIGGGLGRLLLGGGARAAAAEGAAGAVGGTSLLGPLAGIAALLVGGYEFMKYAEDAHAPAAGKTAQMLQQKGLNANPHVGSSGWWDVIKNFHWTDMTGIAPRTKYDNLDAYWGPGATGATPGATTVNQNVTITVDGSHSPKETGAAIADSIQRIQRNALATVR